MSKYKILVLWKCSTLYYVKCISLCSMSVWHIYLILTCSINNVLFCASNNVRSSQFSVTNDYQMKGSLHTQPAFTKFQIDQPLLDENPCCSQKTVAHTPEPSFYARFGEYAVEEGVISGRYSARNTRLDGHGVSRETTGSETPIESKLLALILTLYFV